LQLFEVTGKYQLPIAFLGIKYAQKTKKVSKTIKKVRGVKKPTRRDKESASIGICVSWFDKSNQHIDKKITQRVIFLYQRMFHRKGKTLKKFTCAKKPTLLLQKRK
jgi:hypothetical protein